MKVTDIRIASRSGANGRPSSGDVQFDDGKTFGFGPDMRKIDGKYQQSGWRFYSRRRLAHGGSERVSFAAPKREAALTAHLDAI
jgi:hypothetical protein